MFGGSLTKDVESVRSEIRATLRGQGLRCTSARIAVLVTLHEQQAPMTHEQVMATLPSGAYDKASVWRILSDLADCGILRRMDLGDRVWRYELLDACRAVTDDHPHFLCEACGEVSCLPPLEVRARDGLLPDILLKADFRVRVTGKCGECVGG
jgi:Fur family transcriptional regulator, ferric uptake regulator